MKKILGNTIIIAKVHEFEIPLYVRMTHTVLFSKSVISLIVLGKL